MLDPSLAAWGSRRVFALALAVWVVGPHESSLAAPSTGKIVVAGDEWAFSDAGLPDNGAYVTNVATWFGLLPEGAGKKVLILDGQSSNGGFGGTFGAFGSAFRRLLAANGVAVTYRGVTGNPVSPAGYDAVFADGFVENAATLVPDLAAFVGNGGAVYVAGGTGTFGGGPKVEAAYWKPFFAAATGTGDFGLGDAGWFAEEGALRVSGPVGEGVAVLRWYLGQDVSVGGSPHAKAAVSDSLHALVATWSAPASLSIQRQGSSVVLSWSGSGVLQTAGNPVGPYEDIIPATSPFTRAIDPGGSRFFRLR